MANLSEQRVASFLGYVGAGLFVLGAVVALFSGTIALAGGRLNGALSLWSQSVLLLVVGGLAGFFAWLAGHDWQARPGTAGIMLVLVSLVSAVVLGFGANLLGLVGAVLVFLGGALCLIPPVQKALTAIPTA